MYKGFRGEDGELLCCYCFLLLLLATKHLLQCNYPEDGAIGQHYPLSKKRDDFHEAKISRLVNIFNILDYIFINYALICNH